MKDGLHEHLQKSGIEFIATHGGGCPETFKWDTDIEQHLHRIGFRVKERDTDTGCGYSWIMTTSGVHICLHDGFVHKTVRRRSNKCLHTGSSRSYKVASSSR